MRLAIFESAADLGQGNLRLGVVDGEQIHDATGTVPGLTSADLGSQGLGPVIAAWDEVEAALQDVAGGGDGMSLGDVQLRAPLRPTTIICCAGNYMEGEDRPKRPLNGFMKSPQAVIGPGDTVNLPPHDCSIFHHEAELALVVGRPAFRITEWEAASHVFGYTAFIDVSGRSWPPTNAGASFLGKSFHTFAPLGPVVVTADEVGDPQKSEREAVGQRRSAPGLQHGRYGAPDPDGAGLGRGGGAAAAGRRDRVRHQPPWT